MDNFERIVRLASQYTYEPVTEPSDTHPFAERGIHEGLPMVVRKLFDNSHYAQATFEAFKFLDKKIAKFAKSSQSGCKLMMAAFSESNPLIKLNSLSNTSERDEQKGYQFLFAGSVMAIRNPRGHEFDIKDAPETCLDHLTFVSMLMRRLEEAGLVFDLAKDVSASG